jgi:Na+-driven multidrug efflux pump
VYTLIGASSPLAVDFSALNEVLWLVDLFSILFFFLILICLRQVFIFLKASPERTSSNIPVEERKKNLSSPIDSSFYTIRPPH